MSSIFQVFLWKNYKHAKFQLGGIVLQLIGFVAILAIYMKATNKVNKIPQVVYDTKNEDLLKSYFIGEQDDFIFYTPSNKFVDNLMENIRLELSLPAERLVSFDFPNETIIALEEKVGTRSLAVSFEYTRGDEGIPSTGINYNISTSYSTISTTKIYLNDHDIIGIKDYDNYIESGFFILQRVIDKCYIEMIAHEKGGSNEKESIMVEVAPIPFVGIESIDSYRLVTFGVMYSFFLHTLLLSTVLVPFVEEKQDGIKEFLILATRYSYMNGVTFYFIRFLILFIFTVAALIVGYIWSGLGTVSMCYLLILVFLFIHSTMCYGFLISVLFQSVFYAKVGGLILLLMPTALFTFELDILRPLSYFLSADTFLEGMTTFQKFVNKHRNFEFNSLAMNITSTSFQMLNIYVFLILQSCVYMALYWYLSQLFPGKGGMRRSFYFLFQPFLNKKCEVNNCNEENSLNSADIALKIRNLTKIINNGRNNKKVIVNNVNMDIEGNKITVLLGHNGAGKTTILNMIIGSIKKSGGDIIVDNIKKVACYRHLIGFCPQHNVFMQYLSCYEHLHFFAKLRGHNEDTAARLTTNLLMKLKLLEKSNELGKNLSGGMKRRLSLGLAISGNTKVIVLDEPSSGLDPESRRELWNILLELRKTQAILITTHHMEEAEILGDTVAILSSGKLLCSGSVLELKRKYGSGYILKLIMTKSFNETKSLNIIKEFIPTAAIKSVVYPTTSISLPYNYENQYQKLLVQLEKQAKDIGISSLSITNTTLDEVFLNCESYDETDKPYEKQIEITIDRSPSVPYTQLKNRYNNPTHNPKILAHQGFAVFYKKSVFLKREWAYALFMISIPMFCAIISTCLMNSEIGTPISTQPLNISLDYIPQMEMYLKIPSNIKEFSDIFIKEIEKANVKVNMINEDHNLEMDLLQLQNGNLNYFYDYVLGAVEIVNSETGPIIKILHSANIVHSSVMLLNLIDNVIFKYTTGIDGEISTINVPSKRITEVSQMRMEYFNVMMPVGLVFYMIFYITLPFKEENCEFKKLQFSPKIIYWLSYTIFDIGFHIIVCFIIFAIQSLFLMKEIYNTDELVWIMTTFMFYGISYLPILYILASSFKSMSTLSAFFLFMASISSITPLITSSNQSSMDQYEIVIRIMSILPDFSLNHQVRVISENYFITRRNSVLRSQAVRAMESSHINLKGEQRDALDTTIFFFYAVIVFLISEIFLIFIWDNVNKRHAINNMLTFNSCKRNAAKLVPFTKNEIAVNDDAVEDVIVEDVVDDVAEERSKVQDIVKSDTEICDYPLIVRNLCKTYKNIHAVQGVNFAVRRGECFGLLGVNGAGKTSTFEMITANGNISDGEVFIDGINIRKNENLYKFLFGYCPQVDALNDFMTSYEILKYMALLRGVGLHGIHAEIMKWLSKLELIKYKDIPIQNYSGGTKRKLNTAIAMIGSPPVLFLDEPTTGVDPKSRRFVWKCIQTFQKENRTIVLTSHSMDECEHLCNRLAIMANGRFECLGYIPELKVKFGSGYSLTFRLNLNIIKDIPPALNAKIHNLFKCKLKEQHANTITYSVDDNAIVWSEVLKKVESFYNENRDIFEEYSISETSLEDIFLKFERKNKNGESIV